MEGMPNENTPAGYVEAEYGYAAQVRLAARDGDGDELYGRRLNNHEQWIADDMRRLNPGQHIRYRSGVKVTRALWGPWFYIENRSGYRCETTRVDGAVYARNLIVAYERTPMGGM